MTRSSTFKFQIKRSFLCLRAHILSHAQRHIYGAVGMQADHFAVRVDVRRHDASRARLEVIVICVTAVSPSRVLGPLAVDGAMRTLDSTPCVSEMRVSSYSFEPVMWTVLGNEPTDLIRAFNERIVLVKLRRN